MAIKLFKYKSKNELITPLVVGGMHRSGTSVLLKAISHHRQVYGPVFGEGAFFELFFEFLFDLEEKHHSKEWVIDNYRMGVENRGELMLKFLRNIHAPEIDEADTSLMKYWPVKAQLNIDSYTKLKEIWPRSKYVYIYRNGISVIDSSRNYDAFKSATHANLCERWKRAMEIASGCLQNEDVATVRYENLTDNPEKEFDAIFKKVGLYKDHQPAKLIRSENIDSSYPSEEKPSVEERWDTWSDIEKQVFKDICGSSMRELGYEIPS